jgi:2-aminoethylphosphonate-pyruvate transaminase
MIKTAVILAAGVGSRLGERTADRPKGFLEIEDIPIIEHSIRKLLEVGIEKIIIGTGFMSEIYENFSLKYPQIKCVLNTKYKSTGSMYTLLQLRKHIQKDFILLESDLIYEKLVLQRLMENQKTNVIMASKFTHSCDEVFIEVNDDGHLLNMSKEKKALKNIYGELIGITKISYKAYKRMCSLAKSVIPIKQKLDYEQALVGISGEVKFDVDMIQDIVWGEVDDNTQWDRAVDVIYPLIKARESVPLPVKRNILLNPGPATTTDTVKYAQIIPDICPREKEFGEVMEYISTELTKFVANSEDFTTILFGGSGTSSVEAILSSVVDQHTVIIINNGVYGKRMCQIADAYQLNYLEYKSPTDDALDLKNLENLLRTSHKNISHLAVVHNETTTGLLNPLHAIGTLCKKYEIKLIVDAMSSFAAIPINMKEMNISFLAASSNKNLQGMAGVSFVIANKEHLEGTKEINPRNFYFHLYSQYKHFEMTKQMRFTPPVQTLYALKQAILEAKWEGIKNRKLRYDKMWGILIEGINRLGLEHLVNKGSHSKIITAIMEPTNSNYDFKQMHDFLYEKGFTIYPGKLENLNTFRVANIGDLNDQDIEKFIELLEQYINGISECYHLTKGGEDVVDSKT